MLSIFKSKKPVKQKPVKQTSVRRFVGATPKAMSRFDVSYQKINGELRTDYIQLTLRARELAKNNEIVNSYINLMLRSVLGNTGFYLNSTIYNDDGTSDRIANDTIEKHWREYTKSFRKYVSADHQMNGLDMDRHILFNYLIDGEVFIRKVKDKSSPYGIRFQVLDSLSVDPLYSYWNQGKERICMGIKVDENYKPISYFIRKDNNTDYYLTGERQEVPAKEIIHIYQKRFADQVRGYTPLASVLLNLNGLQEYKRSEINASILNSAFMGIWEKQGSGGINAYEDYDENQIDHLGDVAVQFENNVFRYAPDGYKLNSIANNHPNTNAGGFFKAMLKGVAGSLGMSYNKISSDFESTSYSSLRQANMQDQVTVKQIQQFLIDNWKDLQFAEWLKYLLASNLTNLPYSRMEKFLAHTFQGRNFEYLDPQKEMAAINLRLSMGLSSPIEQIHNLGKDPVEILDSWKKWTQMLADRNLKIATSLQLIENTENIDEQE